MRTADPQAPAPPVPSLRRNFGWTLAGNGIYAATQWGLLVAIARLADVAAVGTFALGLAITAPTFLLTGFQLRGVQATDTDSEFTLTDYVALRAAGMIAGIAITAAVVLFTDLSAPARLVTMSLALSKAIEGLCDVYYGHLQRYERMRTIAISLIARGVLGLIAVTWVLMQGGGLTGAVLTLCFAWALVLLLHDLPAAKRIETPGAHRNLASMRMARIAAVALPLGLVLMLLSLRTNIPRYFLERTVGTTGLGMYAALASLIVAGNVVVSALGQSATPRLARYFSSGDIAAFRALVRRLLVMALSLGGLGVLVTAVAGGPTLRLVFGAEYEGEQRLLLFLMIGGLAAYAGSVLGYALTAARRFRIQLPLFAFSAVACAAAASFLVPRTGTDGAAWSWTLALLLEFALTWAALQYALLKRSSELP